MITQQELKEQLYYNPINGDFIRKVSNSNAVEIGDIAGCDENGYIRIVVNSKAYKAHRLAFLYMTGNFPINQVDHKNHIKNDNRWCNIRLANYSTNNKNTSKRIDNTSGFTGVYKRENGCWRSTISVNKKRITLGTFENLEDAIYARKQANIKYNFHPNHGVQI